MDITAYYDYDMWHMVIKTVFVKEKLTKVMFMTYQMVLLIPRILIRFLGLLKSIYCVYRKFSGSDITFLVLYTDDIFIIGNCTKMLNDVKSWLSKCLQMKDLGGAGFILGIKILRDRSKSLIRPSQIHMLTRS